MTAKELPYSDFRSRSASGRTEGDLQECASLTSRTKVPRHTLRGMRGAESSVIDAWLRKKLPSAGAALLLAVLLASCGSGLPVGFKNETAMHSDAQLMDSWHQAQQNLSRQVYLNPVQHIVYGVPEVLLPGDSRALKFNPRMITVRVVADLTSAQLSVYGVDLPAPTGMIVCPQPCDQGVTMAFSSPPRRSTYVAASREHNESEWDYIVVYEFENHILYGLGYDVSWR